MEVCFYVIIRDGYKWSDYSVGSLGRYFISSVGDYDYTDPGMVEYAEETKARLENLRHELELLDSIEPKLKEVDKGDFAALDALSEDGIKVYRRLWTSFAICRIRM